MDAAGRPPSDAAPLDYAAAAPRREFPVGELLAQFALWSVLVAVVMLAMAVVGRMRALFADFNVKVPGVTLLLLSLQNWLGTWYGVAALCVVPFAATLALMNATPRARRLALRLAVILIGLFVAYVVLALGLPMMTLTEGIRGGKG